MKFLEFCQQMSEVWKYLAGRTGGRLPGMSSQIFHNFFSFLSAFIGFNLAFQIPLQWNKTSCPWFGLFLLLMLLLLLCSAVCARRSSTSGCKNIGRLLFFTFKSATRATIGTSFLFPSSFQFSFLMQQVRRAHAHTRNTKKPIIRQKKTERSRDARKHRSPLKFKKHTHTNQLDIVYL